jgi:hypothetical protein
MATFDGARRGAANGAGSGAGGGDLAATAAVVALAAVFVRATINARAAVRRMRELVASLQNEGICDFARSFNCHVTDTGIIRAVYEDLQDHLEMRYPRHPSFPVRADDSNWQDLDVLIEAPPCSCCDVLYDPVYFVLDAERNSISAVETVRGLVAFFQHQPRLA